VLQPRSTCYRYNFRASSHIVQERLRENFGQTTCSHGLNLWLGSIYCERGGAEAPFPTVMAGVEFSGGFLVWGDAASVQNSKNEDASRKTMRRVVRSLVRQYSRLGIRNQFIGDTPPGDTPGCPRPDEVVEEEKGKRRP